MQSQSLETLKKTLSNPRKIVIVSHQRPDADALGSSLGLYHYLKPLGHQVSVIMPSEYPRFLNWMPGNEQVLIFNKSKNAEEITKIVQQADLIFCLDFSRLCRIDDMSEIVRLSPAQKVLIDHHLDPEKFAEYELWDTKAAATAELVYQFIKKLGGTVSQDAAACLYAGILTDTGSFRYPCTTKEVHLIVAELIEIGIDVSRIHKLIYDNNSENRLRLTGFALFEKLTFLPEYHAAYITLSKNELRRFNSENGDTEGLVNYALSIEGVKLGAIMIEREDGVKLSFRSVGNFSVNEFAAQHFEGGGHCNASGGKSKYSLKETEELFLSILPSYKEKLAEAI